LWRGRAVAKGHAEAKNVSHKRDDAGVDRRREKKENRFTGRRWGRSKDLKHARVPRKIGGRTRKIRDTGQPQRKECDKSKRGRGDTLTAMQGARTKEICHGRCNAKTKAK